MKKIKLLIVGYSKFVEKRLINSIKKIKKIDYRVCSKSKKGKIVYYRNYLEGLNFKPDLILFGHVDRLDYESFLNLKEKYNSIKFAQWFLDPLIENGPDIDKNKNRFFLKYSLK